MEKRVLERLENLINTNKTGVLKRIKRLKGRRAGSLMANLRRTIKKAKEEAK